MIAIIQIQIQMNSKVIDLKVIIATFQIIKKRKILGEEQKNKQIKYNNP